MANAEGGVKGSDSRCRTSTSVSGERPYLGPGVLMAEWPEGR
jgi:hypothetical protein